MDDRSKYLGGSESAAILGLSRWKTPIEVWAEKIGRIEPKDISDKLNVKLGIRLEQTVAELFMEETGKKVRRVNKTLFHPEYPFLGANIDRDVVGEDAILEVKTASGWAAKEWSGEDIPQEYIIQVWHYLMVTGAQKGYIAVLIGNQDFRWKEIHRDNSLIADLMRKEVHFWKSYVETKEMPITITPNDSDVLFRLFPNAVQNEIELSDNANQIIEQIQAYEQDKMQCEDNIDQLKNQLKALLGDNEQGKSDLWKVSWKNQITNRVDVEKLKEKHPDIYSEVLKSSATRVLRYNRIKKEN